MSIIKQLDRPAPPSLNRFYLVAGVLLLLVFNALAMLVHFSPGSFIVFVVDICMAGFIGYVLYNDLNTATLPPDPTAWRETRPVEPIVTTEKLDGDRP